jgi:hypothetical protein
METSDVPADTFVILNFKELKASFSFDPDAGQ